MSLIKNTRKGYSETKDALMGILVSICCNKFSESIENLKKLHKKAISFKAFDLISISMSFMAYWQIKNEPDRYYTALYYINDAKYLANSCDSSLALKVNYFILAQIEYIEKNYKNALQALNEALSYQVGEEEKFDIWILDFKRRTELISKDSESGSDDTSTSLQKEEGRDPMMALLKVGRTMAVEGDIDKLLNIITQEIKLTLNADRCTVFILDKEKNELWSKVALGIDTKEIRFPANLGLAGYVAQTGETVNIKDAYSDSRFNPNIDLKTGYHTETILCMPIRNMSHEITGVFQVLNKKDGYFLEKDEDLLLVMETSVGIALENANLFNKQEKLIEQQKMLLSDFIDTLSASIDARDKITSGHSKRVTMYVELICNVLKIEDKQKDIIRQASLLHDIGKIGIRDSVLQKEGKLTDEEYKHIQEHAKITQDILSKIYASEDFKEVTQIASSHHEKFDGSGYFKKLSGEDIPLGGRILAVGDVFDAITSKRHYRSKMKIEDAIDILIRGKETHFDKKIVDAFLSVPLNLIVNVFLVESSSALDEHDEAFLNEFKFIDLYNAIKKDTRSAKEEKLIETFLKYYEEK